MQIQYRIANRNGNYYPQVKIKRFLLWGSWKKIAKHVTGFGMYGLPSTDHPKTKAQCEEIIRNFDAWFKNENSLIESYTNFNPN